MNFDLQKTVSALVIAASLWGTSQQASYAGLADLLGGEKEEESTMSKSQKADADKVDAGDMSSKDEDSTRLTPKGVRSAVHELFHDEFSDENNDKRLASARKTIEKGEKMMQACGDNHDKAEYKKGKVMKDIGKREIANLKKNPFASQNTLEPERATKRETLDSL